MTREVKALAVVGFAALSIALLMCPAGMVGLYEAHGVDSEAKLIAYSLVAVSVVAFFGCALVGFLQE